MPAGLPADEQHHLTTHPNASPYPAGPTRANTLSLPTEQSLALARLQSLTGAHVSLELPSSLAASLGGRRSETSPSGGGTRQVSLIADELPSISGFVMTGHPGSNLGAPGLTSSRLGAQPAARTAGSPPAGQAEAQQLPAAPTSVQLGHPPRPPTSIQLGHPPRAPTSVQVQPAAPTSVQFGTQPAAPTSIQFGAQPAAPTSIQFLQPAAPTSIQFSAQPAAPTSIQFGTQPAAPTSIQFGAPSAAPTSIQLGAHPAAPASIQFGAQPAAPASVALSGWFGGGSGSGGATSTISPFATDALSPFASSAASSVALPSKAASTKGSSRMEPAGEDDSDDAELVDELAAEAAEDLNGGGGAAARVREVSQQLVNIASSLSPDNASMLLQSGFSMVGGLGALGRGVVRLQAGGGGWEHVLVMSRPCMSMACLRCGCDANTACCVPYAPCSWCLCCPRASMSTRWWPGPTSSSGKGFGWGWLRRAGTEEWKRAVGGQRGWSLSHGRGLCRAVSLQLMAGQLDTAQVDQLLITAGLCLQEDAAVQLDVRPRELRPHCGDDRWVGDRNLCQARPLQPAHLVWRQLRSSQEAPKSQTAQAWRLRRRPARPASLLM